MSKPDPVQHMMLWGAASSGILLVVYFGLTGAISTVSATALAVLMVGIFTGYALGGMAGVLIGAVFRHDQEGIQMSELNNRRLLILLLVFMMVLIVSRILIIVAQGLVAHPLALSLMTAGLAAFASQHYLYRMERYLRDHQPKRKRKNDEIPARLLDDMQEEDVNGGVDASEGGTRRANYPDDPAS